MRTMKALTLLAIVLSITSCRSQAPPPIDGGGGAPLSTCERLQRLPIGDGSILAVYDSLKRDFPEWARPVPAGSPAKAQWVGLPFATVCDRAGYDAVAYNEIDVAKATCGEVEALLVAPARWPEVYTNVYALEAPAALTPGARFSLRTFGSGEKCAVQSAESSGDGFQLVWSCDSTYIVPIPTFGSMPLGRVQQRWSCSAVGSGVRISTQQCQVGRGTDLTNKEYLEERLSEMLQRGQQAWLEGLKCKLDDGAWSVRASARP